jgi:hypothetical protein
VEGRRLDPTVASRVPVSTGLSQTYRTHFVRDGLAKDKSNRKFQFLRIDTGFVRKGGVLSAPPPNK